jgi:steroid 5-alpha reductase family enzyme
MSRARSFLAVAVAYVAAFVVATLVVVLLSGRPTWLTLLAADVAATAVVFAFSVGHNNSSIYDPYWSVAPMVIVVWLATHATAAPLVRQVIVIGLVLAWGARLTWNWARGWQGLGHEDWRYVAIRARTGRAYWWVSWVGIHLMPTLWVYLGSLSLVSAVAIGTRPLGILDALAFAVTAGALVIETLADQQLRAFRLSGPLAGTILATGLWRSSRHPNYLGEIGFWWGLFLFALAADRAWLAIVGPLAINVLFVAISVPLLDRRSIERRAAYADHIAQVPALVPRPWRR